MCSQYGTISDGSNNVIGGNDGYLSYNSAIVAGLTGGIVGSAGAFIGGGLNNLISNEAPSPYYNSNLSAIVAGNTNTIAAPNSFIGSGYGNTILSQTYSVAVTPDAFIGAGYENKTSADYVVIGGGYGNSVAGEYSVIAGGSANADTSTGTTAFIGGGYQNQVTGEYAAIPGGHANIASGFAAAIGGGSSNSAKGFHSTVPGGESNVAAGYDSFAAGKASDAANDGSFVWSDDATGAKELSSTASNQFLARASGGIFLYSSANLKSGVELAPGSGAWSTLSDRAVKTGIKDIDAASILAKVAALPVSEWSYASQGEGVRHLGPMAQDFRTAFGLGEDEKHISTVDEEGVALAAIKGLQAEVAEKDRRLSELDTKYARLEQRLDALENKTQLR